MRILKLRQGELQVLIGVNLLREELASPRSLSSPCSMPAEEGSSLQGLPRMIGRAAPRQRHGGAVRRRRHAIDARGDPRDGRATREQLAHNAELGLAPTPALVAAGASC